MEELEKKYSEIKKYKLHLISKMKTIREQLLNFNDFEVALYMKMSQLVDTKTLRWRRIEQRILDTFSNDNFQELIQDLQEQEKDGNRISLSDLEKITGLFANRNNIFGITGKAELENFETIKEQIYNAVLKNPDLDNSELNPSIKKYLKNFQQLTPLDRVKLAWLEKNYNITLVDAEELIYRFGKDINNINSDNPQYQKMIEHIRAIKAVFYSDNMELLQTVIRNKSCEPLDLFAGAFIREEMQEMFEKQFKDRLYMPAETDEVTRTKYNDKEIKVFNAKTEFDMIVKRVGMEDGRECQQFWNSLTTTTNDFRSQTCASYMTDENLLYKQQEYEVILAFAQGCKNSSFYSMFPEDVGTSFYGEGSLYSERGTEGTRYLAHERGSQFATPETLEANTDGKYNEIVVDKISYNHDGEMSIMQPDYIVYIQKRSDISTEERENDAIWLQSKRAASEFGIPIVVIDKEKILENERKKIAQISQQIKINPNSEETLRFAQKVWHYIARYGEESILEYVAQEDMDLLKQLAKQKQQQIYDIEPPDLEKYRVEGLKSYILQYQQLMQEFPQLSPEEREEALQQLAASMNGEIFSGNQIRQTFFDELEAQGIVVTDDEKAAIVTILQQGDINSIKSEEMRKYIQLHRGQTTNIGLVSRILSKKMEDQVLYGKKTMELSAEEKAIIKHKVNDFNKTISNEYGIKVPFSKIQVDETIGEYFTRLKNIVQLTKKEQLGLSEINGVSTEMRKNLTQQQQQQVVQGE